MLHRAWPPFEIEICEKEGGVNWDEVEPAQVEACRLTRVGLTRSERGNLGLNGEDGQPEQKRVFENP